MVGIVAWRWRRGIPLLTVLSLAAACSGTPAETTVPSTSATTTIAGAPPTTAPPATTTTSTTTSTTTTTTTTLALISDRIEGVPDDLVALIGAPMPEFDRTISANEDGTANVDDIQRWLDEWDAWQTWVDANRPSLTAEVFGYGYVPGSIFDGILDAVQEQPTTMLLSKLFSFEYIDDTSDIGTGYQTGTSLVITANLTTLHSYTVTDGMLESEQGPYADLPAFAVRLLGQEDATGQTVWRVNMMEALNS